MILDLGASSGSDATFVSKPESGMAPVQFRARILTLLVALVAVASALASPTAHDAMAFLAIAAPIVIILGVVRNRPQPTWPWLFIVAGLVFFVAGGVARVHLNTIGNLTSSRS